MGKNKSIKVNYMAFNTSYEIIIPPNYTVSDLANYLRCICTTFVITNINHTSKEITI